MFNSSFNKAHTHTTVVVTHTILYSYISLGVLFECGASLSWELELCTLKAIHELNFNVLYCLILVLSSLLSFEGSYRKSQSCPPRSCKVFITLIGTSLTWPDSLPCRVQKRVWSSKTRLALSSNHIG